MDAFEAVLLVIVLEEGDTARVGGYDDQVARSTGDSAGRQVAQDAKGVVCEDCADLIGVLVNGQQTQSFTLSQDDLLLFRPACDKVADNGMGDDSSRLQGERVHRHVRGNRHDGRWVRSDPRGRSFGLRRV